MTIHRRAVVAVIAAVLLAAAAACSDPAGPAAPIEEPSPSLITGAPAAEPTGVPDACGLISSADLSAALGSDQGTGSPTSTSPERSICIYPTGTITAVELASHYQASREIIDDQGRTTTDVPGVGQAAFHDPAGQLVARGERFFVAVTAPGASVETMSGILRTMLTNAGEAT